MGYQSNYSWANCHCHSMKDHWNNECQTLKYSKLYQNSFKSKKNEGVVSSNAQIDANFKNDDEKSSSKKYDDNIEKILDLKDDDLNGLDNISYLEGDFFGYQNWILINLFEKSIMLFYLCVL